MSQPPPNPGYYPTASGYPPQQHKKSSLLWLWILLGVMVMFFGGCFASLAVVGSSLDTTSKSATTTGGNAPQRAAPTAPAATPSIGVEVRDGNFAFTVTDVQHAPSFGSSVARGEYVIVSMTVKNIGSEPHSYSVGDQKLIDTEGREYAADSSASLFSGGHDDWLVSDLNPGFDIQVQVPFDVPPRTRLSTIEVHDSIFSGGAKIALT